MTRKFSLDRIEQNIAVCYDEDEKKYEFSADRLALAPGSLFTAEIDGDGEPRNVVFLAEETLAVRRDAKRRLDALFARKKNHE